jgi:hypothetical protein
MRLDDRAADPQPQAHPFRLRRTKRFEQPPHVLLINADAPVLHCDEHLSGFARLGTDQQLSWPIRDRFIARSRSSPGSKPLAATARDQHAPMASPLLIRFLRNLLALRLDVDNH